MDGDVRRLYLDLAQQWRAIAEQADQLERGYRRKL